MSTDYEIAAINAIKTVFPGANIHGCLFHLMKNLRKKLSEFHLMQRYNNDSLFALNNARMIISIAFVPKTKIEEAFLLLSDELDDSFDPILKSVSKTHI